jgi:hypothetical protein
MQAVEFTTQLTKENIVSIPEDVAARLPKTGNARIIILTADNNGQTEWRSGAYEQFARDDSPEDAIYDNY